MLYRTSTVLYYRTALLVLYERSVSVRRPPAQPTTVQYSSSKHRPRTVQYSYADEPTMRRGEVEAMIFLVSLTVLADTYIKPQV